MKNKKGLFLKLLLLILAALLFWLSNPNILFENGLGWLAWFNYLPLFFLIKKISLSKAPLYGGLYGTISYALYGYWLNSFHPLGLIIVCIAYFIIAALLFSVLKWAEIVCKKNGWLLQFICVCAYEYIKTLGFFGMSYGVTAYTQWRFITLIQICAIAGVFGLNLLVIFPSSFLFSLITKKIQRQRLFHQVDAARRSHISAYVKKEKELADTSLALTYFCGAIWALLFAAAMIYGNYVMSRPSDNQHVTVAAIQNNESPWKNGIEEYSRNVKNLIQLTEEAQYLS